MHLAGRNPKALTRLPGNPREQRRRVLVGQPVRVRPRQSSCSISAVIPGPSRCSTGLVAQNWATRYSRRLLNPSPFRIIATVAVPLLTCCWLGPASHPGTPRARSRGRPPLQSPDDPTVRRAHPACSPLHLAVGHMLPDTAKSRHDTLRVPGQSNWPENPAFDRNLARLFAGNTCLLGKSTTQKAPQSANRSAL
jgi:hypothetical protein